MDTNILETAKKRILEAGHDHHTNGRAAFLFAAGLIALAEQIGNIARAIAINKENKAS
jgi:hypothetical protein